MAAQFGNQVLPLKCLLCLSGAQLGILFVNHHTDHAPSSVLNINSLKKVKAVTSRAPHQVEAHKLPRSDEAFAAEDVSTLSLKVVLAWKDETRLPKVLRVRFRSSLSMVTAVFTSLILDSPLTTRADDRSEDGTSAEKV